MAAQSTHITRPKALGALVALALAFALAPTPAQSQPDPFMAHEDSKPDPVPVETKVDQTAKTPQPELPTRSPWNKGRLTLGAGTIFSYTTTSNDLPGGGSTDNTTLFFRLTPSVGYFVLDNLEVSVSAGLLSRQLDRGGTSLAIENDFLMEVSGRYFLPVTKNFALFADLGLGGYLGSSERILKLPLAEGADPVNINEQTDTLGFAFSTTLGVGYNVGGDLQIRAGLGLTGLIGSEDITSLNKSLSVSTLNTGLMMGLHYQF